MRDRSLAHHLLVVLTALLVSATASAQVALTDEASGVSLTLSGSWAVMEDSEFALAVNEEGCLMALVVVPEADAEVTVSDLDGFLSSFIEAPEVVEAGWSEDDSFAAVGTGLVEGEAVEWLLAGGFDSGWFGLTFAAATASAVTCADEMQTLVGF